MAQLSLLIDRLHWGYHKGCRDPHSSYYVPDVDPTKYSALVGVDTEAAEQVFHIANRWQLILSNAHPIHQELMMLVFAREHNKVHSCDHAIQVYKAAQKAPVEAISQAVLSGGFGACEGKPPRRKRKKIVQPPEECSDPISTTATPSDMFFAVLNATSNAVHSVVLPKDVYSECGWSFQGRAQPSQKAGFVGKGYFSCGVCYGVRMPL